MTYEEYLVIMHETIPECCYDQDEIDDVWEDMQRYEVYDCCDED